MFVNIILLNICYLNITGNGAQSSSCGFSLAKMHKMNLEPVPNGAVNFSTSEWCFSKRKRSNKFSVEILPQTSPMREDFFVSVGIHPDNLLLRITTTSNKCEILNNFNLKVGESSGRVVNHCC